MSVSVIPFQSEMKTISYSRNSHKSLTEQLHKAWLGTWLLHSFFYKNDFISTLRMEFFQNCEQLRNKLRPRFYEVWFIFQNINNVMQWSKHLEVFSEKCVLKNVAKFTGKHMCQSLFLIKLSKLSKLSNLSKKRLCHTCFPVNFVKFLRTPFFNRASPVAASKWITF